MHPGNALMMKTICIAVIWFLIEMDALFQGNNDVCMSSENNEISLIFAFVHIYLYVL